ncbi:MAG: hypothetical protein ACPLN0_00775 [Candidatus Hydrothermia bacterium]
MRKSFTVLELAIVLILIGILIGIVIRGATTTSSAKIDATIECYRVNLLSVESYFNTYRKLPGDNNQDGKIETDAIPILKNSNFDVKTTNPYGGSFNILWKNFPAVDSGNYIFSDKIPLSADSIIDSRIDDGNLNTGKYRRISNVSYLKI